MRQTINCKKLQLSLEIPEYAGDGTEDYEISALSASDNNVPSIYCDFGETILSDVIQIKPLWQRLLKPIVLTLNHSVIELPELTSIVIKSYDNEHGEWITLCQNSG